MTKIVGPEIVNELTRLIERDPAPVIRPAEIIDQLRFEMPDCDLTNEEMSRLTAKIASRLGRALKLGE